MTATYQVKQEELLKEVYAVCQNAALTLEQIRDRIQERRPDLGDISLSQIEQLYDLLDQSGLVRRL